MDATSRVESQPMQATRSNPGFKSGPRASTAPPASLLSGIGLVFWMCAAVVALVVVAVIMILQDLPGACGRTQEAGSTAPWSRSVPEPRWWVRKAGVQVSAEGGPPPASARGGKKAAR